MDNSENNTPEYVFEQLAMMQTKTIEGIVRLLELAAVDMSERAMRHGIERPDRLAAIAIVAALKLVLIDHPEFADQYKKDSLQKAEENLSKTRPVGYFEPETWNDEVPKENLFQWKLVSLQENRPVEVIRNTSGEIVDMKPDESGYTGSAVFENRDGTTLKFNLSNLVQDPNPWFNYPKEKSVNNLE